MCSSTTKYFSPSFSYKAFSFPCRAEASIYASKLPFPPSRDRREQRIAPNRAAKLFDLDYLLHLATVRNTTIVNAYLQEGMKRTHPIVHARNRPLPLLDLDDPAAPLPIRH